MALLGLFCPVYFESRSQLVKGTISLGLSLPLRSFRAISCACFSILTIVVIDMEQRICGFTEVATTAIVHYCYYFAGWINRCKILHGI